jgi:hypothetical protein
MKANGISPVTQAFLYKSYCLSKATYSLGCMSLTKSSIKALNIIQNTLTRLSLSLQKYSHTALILKSLKIYDIKTLVAINVCSQLSLLHRHEITKKFLNYFINNNQCEFGSKSFYFNINDISEVTSKSLDSVINFPGINRNIIIQQYYDVGDNQMEFIFIENFLENYDLKNTKVLKDICCMNFITRQDEK